MKDCLLVDVFGTVLGMTHTYVELLNGTFRRVLDDINES